MSKNLNPVLDPQFILNLFQKNLSKFSPQGKKNLKVEIKSVGEFLFKKALKYKVTTQNKRSQKERQTFKEIAIIRGNVPSQDTPQESEVAFKTQNYLYKHQFDKGPFQVSKPLLYLPKLALILYQELPGRPLTSYLKKKHSQSLLYTKRAARWLTKLHNLKVKFGRKKTLAQEKVEMKYFVMDYANYTKEIQKQGKEILKKIFEAKQKIDNPKRHTLIHGDFNPNNIIIKSPKETGVIDFGNSWYFDPLSDVGNFLAQLDLLVWHYYFNRGLIERAKKVFLAEYLKTWKGKDKETLKNIKILQAWWTMQIMAYVLKVRIKGVGKRGRRVILGALKSAKEYLNYFNTH